MLGPNVYYIFSYDSVYCRSHQSILSLRSASCQSLKWIEEYVKKWCHFLGQLHPVPYRGAFWLWLNKPSEDVWCAFIHIRLYRYTDHSQQSDSPRLSSSVLLQFHRSAWWWTNYESWVDSISKSLATPQYEPIFVHLFCVTRSVTHKILAQPSCKRCFRYSVLPFLYKCSYALRWKRVPFPF